MSKFSLSKTFTSLSGQKVGFMPEGAAIDSATFKAGLVAALESVPVTEQGHARPLTPAEGLRRNEVMRKIAAAEGDEIDLSVSEVEMMQGLFYHSFAPAGALPLVDYLESATAMAPPKVTE